jgi:hypothetical protein
MNTGDKPVTSKSGLLTTIAWQLASGELRYALEGSAFIAGAAVQWLRDGLGLFASAAEVEELARQVPDSGGVVVVPAFAGLGAPHWRPDARALISGLTRGATRAHIARATLEGIALQNVDILRAMERDSGRALGTLKVDGGAAANDLLMQLQSDLLGVDIARPELVESTALGAAFLVGIGMGAETDIIGFLVTRYFGLRSFGAAFGFAFGSFVVAGGFGALLMGAGFDRSGSYRLPLAACFLATLLAVALFTRLGPYRYAVIRPQNQRSKGTAALRIAEM